MFALHFYWLRTHCCCRYNMCMYMCIVTIYLAKCSSNNIQIHSMAIATNTKHFQTIKHFSLTIYLEWTKSIRAIFLANQLFYFVLNFMCANRLFSAFDITRKLNFGTTSISCCHSGLMYGPHV